MSLPTLNWSQCASGSITTWKSCTACGMGLLDSTHSRASALLQSVYCAPEHGNSLAVQLATHRLVPPPLLRIFAVQQAVPGMRLHGIGQGDGRLVLQPLKRNGNNSSKGPSLLRLLAARFSSSASSAAPVGLLIQPAVKQARTCRLWRGGVIDSTLAACLRLCFARLTYGSGTGRPSGPSGPGSRGTGGSQR